MSDLLIDERVRQKNNSNPYLYEETTKSPHGLSLIKRLDEELKILCKNNDENNKIVMFDIGANIGVFSLLAKKYSNLIIYAFEPVKETYSILVNNIRLNNLESRVIPVNCALSNDKNVKTMDIRIPESEHCGLVTLGERPLRFHNYKTEVVNVDTIDNFCEINNITKIDIMKLDTEGWEYFILMGGKTIISNSHPIIFSEYNETNAKQCGLNLDELTSVLTTLGYNFEIFEGEDIICKYKL